MNYPDGISGDDLAYMQGDYFGDDDYGDNYDEDEDEDEE